jgi:hypothetical protein
LSVDSTIDSAPLGASLRLAAVAAAAVAAVIGDENVNAGVGVEVVDGDGEPVVGNGDPDEGGDCGIVMGAVVLPDIVETIIGCVPLQSLSAILSGTVVSRCDRCHPQRVMLVTR